jgi:hypothetical protein
MGKRHSDSALVRLAGRFSDHAKGGARPTLPARRSRSLGRSGLQIAGGVADEVVAGEVIEAAHRRARVVLLVLEVLQQVEVELLEAIDHTPPCVALGGGQLASRGLDDVKQA